MKMSERCQKYAGHGGDGCGRTLTGTPESTDVTERPENWETAGQCPLSWNTTLRGPGVTTWPPAESLCGEEEALAAGSFAEDGPVPPIDQAAIDLGLEQWEKYCRNVGRNRV